jgi:hypothetical protein
VSDEFEHTASTCARVSRSKARRCSITDFSIPACCQQGSAPRRPIRVCAGGFAGGGAPWASKGAQNKRAPARKENIFNDMRETSDEGNFQRLEVVGKV